MEAQSAALVGGATDCTVPVLGDAMPAVFARVGGFARGVGGRAFTFLGVELAAPPLLAVRGETAVCIAALSAGRAIVVTCPGFGAVFASRAVGGASDPAATHVFGAVSVVVAHVRRQAICIAADNALVVLQRA